MYSMLPLVSAVFLLSISAFAIETEYIIFPKQSLSAEAIQELGSRIAKLAGGEKNVYASKIPPTTTIFFFLARLTKEDGQKIHEDKGVRFITPHEEAAQPFGMAKLPSSEQANIGETYETQTTPDATELRVISQPSGTADYTHYKNYVWRSDSKRDTYIYHLELGINPDHEDFRGRQIEWVYTPITTHLGQASPSEVRRPKSFGHSTCTASKAAGYIYGSNKHSTLVVVKMSDYSVASILEAIRITYHHIDTYNRRRRSVVNISWGSTSIFDLTPEQIETWNIINYEIYSNLDRQAVKIVFAAGNAATEKTARGQSRKNIDTFPIRNYFSLFSEGIVVGNSDNRGYKYKSSQESSGDIRMIYAPGVNVKCAKPDSNTGYNVWTGTSFSNRATSAAPLVAGVVAGLLSLGAFGPGPGFQPDLMKYASWKRAGEGERVIWNTVPREINPPEELTTMNNTRPNYDASMERS
ncbi:MAG: hypothetical protein Q9164_006099 [Protoblastenia rupestris]